MLQPVFQNRKPTEKFRNNDLKLSSEERALK